MPTYEVERHDSCLTWYEELLDLQDEGFQLKSEDRHLEAGFLDVANNRLHVIGLARIKATLGTLPGVVQEMVKTPQGRRGLIEVAG